MPLVLPTQRVLTLEAARLALAAAEATAHQNGWKVVIAAVDAGGHLVAAIRLDGTQTSSVDTALGKARAAAAFKRPSRVLEEMVNGPRPAFATVPGAGSDFTLLQGALPIEVDGQVIGAIGVSGVKASDDEIVAGAGVKALLDALG
jgi:glc operon protein GlcG